MEARFSAPVQTGPEAHPASCATGTGSFPGVKSGRGVTLTPHPLLVTRSRKSRAIPLLPYGPYDLYRVSVPVQGYILPFPQNSTIQPLHKLTQFSRSTCRPSSPACTIGHPLLHVPYSALLHGYGANMLHLLSPPCMLHVSTLLFFSPFHVGIKKKNCILLNSFALPFSNSYEIRGPSHRLITCRLEKK